jgi:hypothetical protein
MSDDLFHESETRTVVGAHTRSDEVEYDDNNSAIGHKCRADRFVMRTDHQRSRPTHHQQTETHLDDSSVFDSDISRRACFRDLGGSRALRAAASGNTSSSDGNSSCGRSGSGEESSDTDNSVDECHGTDDRPRAGANGQRTGKTTRWIGGFSYTQANISGVKCPHYRLVGVRYPGKCDHMLATRRYGNFTAHAWEVTPDERESNAPRHVDIDVSVKMKRAVDTLSVATSDT